jgi:hypothetical protein
VKGIVANRVHGAVCVAGFGRPAVIVGNDARIGIARPIGIPAIDSSAATADWILESLDTQFDHVNALREQRIELRESSAKRYVQQIAACLEARRPPVVQDDNGFRFVMYPHLKPYSQVLLNRKCTTGQNAAVAKLVGRNDVVFDVGAHAGRFSMFIERLRGFDGTIYAFEPVPASFSMLAENLRLNTSTKVRATQCAVGEARGSVSMNLFPAEFSSWNSRGKPLMTAPGGK